MSVAAVNLVLDKGTDFDATFNVSGSDNGPVGLSNYTGISKIRKYPTSPKSKSFAVAVDSAEASVTISMARTDTSQLSSGRNYFDVFLRDITTGDTIKVVEGTMIVQDGVSM